jgi:sensor histidine kinase YesM
MLILTVAIVIIASLSMGYLVQNYVARINREFNDIYSDSADLYVSAVGDKLFSYITAMGVVSMSNDLRDNIFRDNVSRSEMVTLGRELRQNISEMTFFLYQSREVISHRLYTFLPSDGYYFWNISDVEELDCFIKLKQSSPQWWYTYSNVTRSNHLTLASIINNFNSTEGTWGQGHCYQTIAVNTAVLFMPDLGLETKVYLFDNKTGNIIYNNSSTSQREKLDIIQKQYDEAYPKTQGSRAFPEKILLTDDEGKSVEYTAMTRQIDLIDITAVMLFNPKQIEETNGVGVIYGTVILLFFMMLLLILSNWIYNRRLNKIIVRMDKFDEKDVLLPEPIGGKDELARIDKHLLRMQRRISTLIQEEYTAKMQVMTAQREALLTCINPHFLYNTLNTISAMACVEGADGTVEMIASLSDMFRYSSDLSKQHVALREELDNITNYLYIQSIRYQNAFTYSVDIPETLYDSLVPKLILQPIVENAFKHGFKNHMTEREGDRQIQISAEQIEDDLIISIIDNGIGVSAEQLSILREQMSVPESKRTSYVMENGSIGLLNVHHRIRLWYGLEYGLQFISEGEGTGLRVSVHIPCHKK